jgi:diguanylate cyclase (GGDEF)-like protein
MTEKAVILIVDDTRLNIQTLAHILKNDYIIKIAHGGAQALELVAQDPIPDLILLDVEMPEISGYDVCRRLCEIKDTANIPIIFVTGKDSAQEEEYGLSLGAVDYITKPIHPSVVKARVNTHITLKRQYDLLKKIAVRDQLTTLYNRHYLTDALMRKVAYAARHKEPLSIAIIDIDHFKNINDTYGHMVGDDVLREIASIIDRHTRKEDIAARFGGEEFILVLGSCTLEDARIKAEQLRKEIEEYYPAGIDVTASFGIVQLGESIHSCAHLLDLADQALYRAKKEGRNKVVSYEQEKFFEDQTRVALPK